MFKFEDKKIEGLFSLFCSKKFIKLKSEEIFECVAFGLVKRLLFLLSMSVGEASFAGSFATRWKRVGLCVS